MFRSNVSCTFLYIVVKVSDEKTWKVSTGVNGLQYLRACRLIILDVHLEFINYLVQFFTGRCQSYSISENLHLAVCTSFETMCFACLYKCLKIVNFVFLSI